jgi:hypothetical protein
MQIYVGKNSQQLGPFSLEEVNRKLADGTFAGTDLGWYEGAAGWAALSSLPGVVIPAPAGTTPAPLPTPVRPAPVTPPQPAPAVTPVRANVPIVQPPRSATRTLSLVSWGLLAFTFLVSLIPVVGCGAWLVMGIPVALTAIILGIIMLSRGGTGAGILSIIGGVLIVPTCFAASAFSILVFGGTLERKEQAQIKENLVLIDSAKTKWVAETKATNGAPVTMANLKSQLGGKQIKPVVEETYDPMPVGQPPTATLPANKTLGTFNGGDVLTATSIDTALANSSTFKWNFRRNTSASPSPSVAPRPSASPSPRASAAPSVTVSPSPSLSPRSTATPHSLISPRRSEETEESPSSRQPPSTRPSPTAKFAPRVNPRQSPSNRSDSDAGGLRQGRQQPRESPAETPEPSASPDDDTMQE